MRPFQQQQSEDVAVAGHRETAAVETDACALLQAYPHRGELILYGLKFAPLATDPFLVADNCPPAVARGLLELVPECALVDLEREVAVEAVIDATVVNDGLLSDRLVRGEVVSLFDSHCATSLTRKGQR